MDLFTADLFTTENAIALLTLSALEIVLGIDNLVFISILSAKLPPERQRAARRLGLFLAMFLRIGLLFAIGAIMRLTAPWFEVAGIEISGRDLILLAGGLFLIGKATWEIHEKVEHPDGLARSAEGRPAASFASVITQILLLDLVFSIDSVITAVGMADQIAVMALAVVLAVVVMMIFAEPVSAFIERHPTLKVLALSFLILIGVLLTAEGLGKHLNKGYVYFAMAFSLAVELLNTRMRARRGPGARSA